MSSRIAVPNHLGNADPTTPNSLAEAFIQHGIYLKNWSLRTVRTYRQAFGSLSRFQQSQREGDSTNVAHTVVLTKAQLEAWIMWMRQSGVSPGGVNMYLRTMNSFLSWAHEEGHLSGHIKLKLLSNPAQPIQAFSDAEVRLLLAYRPRRFTEFRTWTIAQTLLDTGCRINELLEGLTIREVDLDNTKLLVIGKGNKQRQVPFSFELRKILFRYLQLRSKRGIPGDTLFCSHSGTGLMYRNTYRDLKTLCASAGIKGSHVRPHVFRHTFAVSYIRNGGDIYSLSRILGHNSLTTTQIYLRAMNIEQVAKMHSRFSPLAQGR